MNHFMLPDDGGRDTVGASARYGNLCDGSADQPSAQNRGRAAVVSKPRCSAAAPSWPACRRSNVGARNAEFVLDYLKVRKNPCRGKRLAGFISAKSLLFPRQRVGFWSKSCTGFITRPYSAAKKITRIVSLAPRWKAKSSCLFDLTNTPTMIGQA
jgi:hypothetical protein